MQNPLCALNPMYRLNPKLKNPEIVPVTAASSPDGEAGRAFRTLVYKQNTPLFQVQMKKHDNMVAH